VPEVLLRRDDERGLVIVVEGAEAEEVGAVTLERDPSRLGQALERDLALDAAEDVVGDAGHQGTPTFSPEAVKQRCPEIMAFNT
jgi:hypothetical protein